MTLWLSFGILLLIVPLMSWWRVRKKSSLSDVPASPALTSDVLYEIRSLIDSGKKVEAVKRVREATNWGLRESKEYVDALSQGGEPAFSAPPDSSSGVTSPEDMRQVAAQLLSQGKKIEAVKHVREATRWGLREAKVYVEALESGAELPEFSQSTIGQEPPVDLREAVRDLLNQRRKIEAVKLVREHTNWGLKEAKDYVDAIETE